MAINKVQFGGSTLIDLSTDTVATANDIASGKVGHLNDGTVVTGTHSGSAYAMIVVNFPSSTTSCTCDTASGSKDISSTQKLFYVSSSGSYTVVATDGIQTATRTVSITYEGQSQEISLSYSILLSQVSEEYVKGSVTTVTHSTGSSWRIANGAGASVNEYFTFTINIMTLIAEYFPQATKIFINPINIGTFPLDLKPSTTTADPTLAISTLPATLTVSGLPSACYIGTHWGDNAVWTFNDISFTAVE